ncbi:HU family DNA-binding protein [Lentimicrobium sp. S6]|uniref:HU family DNA-binding protein n=1 Tax=Lentimicrobium sp. S6 TaxID=2735872 RepID=UPI0020A68677|nr:HU family DNA-binding protein [Lentimicrobium sp. S6]
MIKYKVIPLADKISSAVVKYQYYPRICDREKINLLELSRLISRQCSFTTADVYGVLEAFVGNIPSLLLENKSIELGDLGIFSLHAKAKGSPEKQQVTKNNITELKIAFRPSKRLKQSLVGAKFQKVKS